MDILYLKMQYTIDYQEEGCFNIMIKCGIFEQYISIEDPHTFFQNIEQNIQSVKEYNSLIISPSASNGCIEMNYNNNRLTFGVGAFGGRDKGYHTSSIEVDSKFLLKLLEEIKQLIIN